MKALNYKEVRAAYIVFLAYFTGLLILTVLCWSFTLVTESSFNNIIQAKKDEVENYKNQTAYLSSRIDSIQTYISMLNTDMVTNDDALEVKIIQMKTQSLIDIEKIEMDSKFNFTIYKKILVDIERIIEAKKSLQQNKLEEDISQKKLQECNNANLKLRNRNK
ncbi:hypothetical protein [uncultured Cytophaga sp.]|uniref:hypothetical protein n=1 Tax=uncultured Cytophaga sp. TaxID=160238 RepID=UPI00263579B7|nr:hypothetical protein [uncultured Cytophaga sp.]